MDRLDTTHFPTVIMTREIGQTYVTWKVVHGFSKKKKKRKKKSGSRVLNSEAK